MTRPVRDFPMQIETPLAQAAEMPAPADRFSIP
jgi:hypothetical protein